ncbi:hypothetical protein ACP6H1_21125 [Vibrio harveyi]|uniref:Type III secretion protein n=2 Tax=Vibrio TaxID=662 RepID=A0ABM5XTC2_VIBHA|nr:hypothetical protein [Vibrio harveyi]AMF96303.1 hypothetical protein AL538_00475 [Vibrio harveyi]EKO3870268.1 hypothetical protein [Vibrio harveyi]ELC3158221.1 hypothetical protein [Vibrio harveyi]HEQ3589940.1 hypothetical protein [Vibrio harveyi]HEQ3598407.1 hypothetical protein [Vibrio harveyi]
MKIPSKQWGEFGQLINIIDIRIRKQQRKLIKLKKQKRALVAHIEKLWLQIDQEQIALKTLNVQDEDDALKRLFLRREDCKSHIESFFFDVSIKQQKAETLAQEIETSESKKRKLEKRKEALGELRNLIRGEES